MGLPKKFGFLSNTSITDLNEFLGERGCLTLYLCSPSTPPANLPSEISSADRFFLEVINSGDYDIVQRVTKRGSSKTYCRYRVGSDSIPPIAWSTWG